MEIENHILEKINHDQASKKVCESLEENLDHAERMVQQKIAAEKAKAAEIDKKTAQEGMVKPSIKKSQALPETDKVRVPDEIPISQSRSEDPKKVKVLDKDSLGEAQQMMELSLMAEINGDSNDVQKKKSKSSNKKS